MLFRTQLSMDIISSDSESPSSRTVIQNHHHNPRNYHKKGVLGVLETSEYLIARRRAAEVAIVSIESMIHEQRTQDKFGAMYRDLTFQEAELRSIQQKSQLELHKQLLKMDTKFKLQIIFDIVDLDNSRRVSAFELAKILQLIQGANSSFDEAFKAAKLTMAANASDGDMDLGFNDFCSFIDSIASFLNRSSDDVAHFLIIEITSLYNGNFIINETMEQFTFQPTTESTHNRCKMSPSERARLLVVFTLLDSMTQGGRRGSVEFQSVVHAMTPLTKGMDQKFVKLLFAINDEDPELSQRKRFDFQQFLEFVTKVKTASPSDVSIDAIANMLTIHLSSTTVSGSGEYMSIDFSAMKQQCERTLRRSNSDTPITAPTAKSHHGAINRRRSLDSNDHSGGDGGAPSLTLKDQQRIERLFNIWDNNHDRELEMVDLFIGLRKFHEVKQLGDEAMSPTLSSMKQHELSKVDQAITMEDFETIIVKYAKEVNTPLNEMIDFMYIQTLMVGDNVSANSNNKNSGNKNCVLDRGGRKLSTDMRVSHRNLLQDTAFYYSGGVDEKSKDLDIVNTYTPQQRSKSYHTMPSWGNLWNIRHGLAEELNYSSQRCEQNWKRSLFISTSNISSSRISQRNQLYDTSKRRYSPTATSKRFQGTGTNSSTIITSPKRASESDVKRAPPRIGKPRRATMAF